MTLKQIMTRDVRGIERNAPIRGAAMLMSDMGVGAVPVFENGELCGIVTDRDVVVRAVARGKDCINTQVGQIMSDRPVVLSQDTDVAEAVRQMEEHQIRRLLVSGPDGKIVGIVSLGDLATRTHDRELSGECIEEISSPSEPLRT